MNAADQRNPVLSEIFRLASSGDALEARVAERPRRLRELSITDELTSLYNRRYLPEILENEYSSFKRYGAPLSVAIFDIDRFKGINDTYGHLTGDEVLKTTSGILKQTTRDADTIGRYGGEEFLLIMPRTDTARALIVADRFRKKIAESRFSDPGIQVSISGGVAGLTQGETIDQLVSRADKRLYRAKENGRNRIEA